MKKLVLFDIDGTLLRSRGAGRRSIHRAMLEHFGTAGPIDGYRFDGKTDPQIVRELLHAAGHPHADDPDRILEACALYVQMLEHELAREGHQVWVLEGVLELLEALEGTGDLLIGLLTGNLEQGARLKLRSAGLEWTRFRVGAFGSDAAERSALPPVAAERARDLMGRVPSGHDVVIIGDTPADVACGAGIGARALAVATGSYTVAQLEATGAFSVFDALTDTDRVLEAIVT